MTFADRAIGVAVREGSECELAVTIQMDVQFVISVSIGASVISTGVPEPRFFLGRLFNLRNRVEAGLRLARDVEAFGYVSD